MPSPTCPECAAAVAADQRYCLQCGARVAALRPVRVAARRAQAAPDDPPPRGTAHALPPPRIAAALVLAVLGFGVLVGAAVSPDVEGTLAAGRPNLRIVLPPAPRPAPAPARPHRAAPPPAAPSPEPPATASPPAAAPSPPAPSPPAPEPQPAPEAPAPAAPPPPAAPPLRHVWVVSLAEQPQARTFADPVAMPYLAGELRRRGELLTGFSAIGGSGLAGGAALLGGRRPTPDQDAGCPTYADQTCVRGPDVYTLADQLVGNGLTWKAYAESIGTPCRHPPLGQPDSAPPQARPGDPFATARVAPLYFHTIIDSPDCARLVVGLDALAPDLEKAATTPAFSLVVPDLCHDGRDAPCADGAPAGPAAADAWLRGVLPGILASPAYADRGLVVVTTDHAPDGGPVGALLLSRYVKPGAEVAVRYDAIALLRAVQDAFGLRHLGLSGRADRPRFGRAVWSRWSRNVHGTDTG